ncbi:MAG: hypothetical protein PR2021_4290 [Candidatus Phytoplasma pruni]|nr:MAG: hypothetical protein PR2021_4290 [Candidatus Phytoplasma pruni]
MTLRQLLTLIALSEICVFILYKFGFIVPDSTKITWLK